jgi:glycosyltransferase EpsF
MEQHKKIKVAQVIGNSTCGGVPSFIMNYFRNIDRNKIDFYFYTYGPSELDAEILHLNGKIVHMPDVRNIFKSIPFLKKSFSEQNFDIVHSHMTTLSISPLLAAKLAGINIRICHAHSTTNRNESTYIIKNLLKPFSNPLASHLSGCSHLSMNWLFGKKKGASSVLIPNSIDLSLFHKNEKRSNELKKTLEIENKFIIGNIGRFETQKNHLFLVDCFLKTLEAIPSAVLILVGKGKKEKLIREKILSYNIADKVIFLPETSDIVKYYEIFDIFWLPSLYEGLPLVGVEAQAMNLPCLFSDKISREADLTGTTIFLPINNPLSWAETTLMIYREKPTYQNFATLEAKGYDIKDSAPKLLEYYNSLLKL